MKLHPSGQRPRRKHHRACLVARRKVPLGCPRRLLPEKPAGAHDYYSHSDSAIHNCIKAHYVNKTNIWAALSGNSWHSHHVLRVTIVCALATGRILSSVRLHTGRSSADPEFWFHRSKPTGTSIFQIWTCMFTWCLQSRNKFYNVCLGLVTMPSNSCSRSAPMAFFARTH